MDDEERDWVPGQEKGSRFSFGSEIRRLEGKIEGMKLARTGPDQSKNKSISDIVSDLCNDIELFSNNFDDYLHESTNPLPSSLLNFDLGRENIINKESGNSMISETSNSHYDYLIRHDEPLYAPTRSISTTKALVINEDIKSNVTGILNHKKFKKPLQRVENNHVSNTPKITHEELKNCTSNSPKSAPKLKTSSKTINLESAQSIMLTAEMIATKPKPPLSKEEKTVTYIY